MMKTLMTSLAALALAAPMAFAAAHEEDGPSEEAVTRIMDMLAEMRCEMDPDDIEVEDDGGYDLDDVICAEEGQMDVKLDSEFNITDRRME